MPSGEFLTSNPIDETPHHWYSDTMLKQLVARLKDLFGRTNTRVIEAPPALPDPHVRRLNIRATPEAILTAWEIDAGGLDLIQEVEWSNEG